MDTRSAPGAEPDQNAEKQRQIAGLNGLRAVAALVVMVGHIGQYADATWLSVRGFGPIALFCLSGFLLFRPYGRWALGLVERPSTKSFAIRRVLRIFPAYWLVLHVVYVVVPGAAPRSFGEWIQDITLISAMQFSQLIPSLAQVWSVGVEVTWYLVLPLFGLVAHLLVRGRDVRTRFFLLMAVLLATAPVSLTFTWAVFENHVSGDGSMWLPRYLVCFAMGALVALALDAERAGVFRLDRWRAAAASPWIFPAVIVVALAVSATELLGGHGLERLTFAEAWVGMVVGLVLVVSLLVVATLGDQRSFLGRWLAAPWLQTTGRWSYGIFLWHLPVISVLATDEVMPASLLGQVLWYLLVIAVTFPLAAATYAWVEEPLMRWSRRLTPASGPTVAQQLAGVGQGASDGR